MLWYILKKGQNEDQLQNKHLIAWSLGKKVMSRLVSKNITSTIWFTFFKASQSYKVTMYIIDGNYTNARYLIPYPIEKRVVETFCV